MRVPHILQASFPNPFTLGIDDSDTPWGGCTTHLAWIVLGRLKDEIVLKDYPLLIRLNPVVPRKTRGNAAVVIRGYSSLTPNQLYDKVLEIISEYTRIRMPGKAPGIALYHGVDPWRDPLLRNLYLRGLREYIPREYVMEVARRRRIQLKVHGGTGIVGAVLSLAGLSPWDPYTFELIAYRKPENIGKPRCIDKDPLKESRYPLCEYGNYDLLSGKLVAAPGGPDPVLAGFRGNEPSCLGTLSELLCEEPAGWILYRTNQHTGAGPLRVHPRPYNYVKVKGVVKSMPRELPGGHVIVRVETSWGEIPLAFYRETGPLRDAARLLVTGDLIEAEGGLVPRKEGNTLAADTLVVLRLAREKIRIAPRCPKCGTRMKSMGRLKGYRCPKCGYKDRSARPVEIDIPRVLVPGRYTSPVSSARHLTRYNWWMPRIGGTLEPLPTYCFASWRSEPPLLSIDPNKCLPMVKHPSVSSGG